MKTVAIVQARMSSSRLPNKVMAEIIQRPMLDLMLERVRRSDYTDAVVVATSLDHSDDPIADWCNFQDQAFYRGSLNDVLDRYYRAACHFCADQIVRITADCPLIDWSVIDRVIYERQQHGVDYASNVIPPSYPDGMDVEVFTFQTLERAWLEAKKASEREHVTLYINQRPHIFSIHNVIHQEDLSHCRWTVDQAEDLEVVRSVYKALYPINPEFGFQEIVQFMNERPDIFLVNKDIHRNEGLKKSLASD